MTFIEGAIHLKMFALDVRKSWIVIVFLAVRRYAS